MNLEKIILQYEKKENMLISFEACHPLLYRIPELELTMEHYQHHAQICRLHKQKDESRSCWQNKIKLLKKAQKGVPFCMTCPFGVTEYVVPVRQEEILLGVFFINIQSEKGRMVQAEKAGGFLAEFIRIEFSLSNVVTEFVSKLHQENYYRENSHLFIERHFHENIGIGDLAEQLHVNSNYLSGVIRHASGKTFRQMLTERRLSEACIWLRNRPDFSITEIAFRCGFQDANYFSTVFRRHCGITPGEYRSKKTECFLYPK